MPNNEYSPPTKDLTVIPKAQWDRVRKDNLRLIEENKALSQDFIAVFDDRAKIRNRVEQQKQIIRQLNFKIRELEVQLGK